MPGNPTVALQQDPPPKINTISIELLSLILHYAGHDYEEEIDPIRIYDQNLHIANLSAVCSHWRRTAICDGTLWCNISFSPSLLSTINCAAEFLRRSRNSSITLTTWNADASDRHAVAESREMKILLENLGQNCHRVTAFVSIDPPDTVILALDRPATRLVHLDIQTTQHRSIPEVFSGTMPNLECLSISNPEGWKIQLFENLHTVHVTAPSWRLWCLSVLLDFLDARVPINELHLTCFEHFETENAMESGRIIPLSSLQIIRLTFCDSVLILNHLDIPPSTAISIYGRYGQSEDISAGFPKSSGFMQSMRTAQHLTVVFDVEKQVFEVEVLTVDGVDLLLGAVPRQACFGREWVLRSMNTVTRLTPVAGVKWLTVVIDGDRMPWKSWLSKLTQLSVLEVRCPDPEELLGVLAAPSEENEELLCPSLRSFSIERNKRPTMDASLLRKFLEGRALAGRTLSSLNVNDLDWSGIPDMEFETWEGVINRTGSNPTTRTFSGRADVLLDS